MVDMNSPSNEYPLRIGEVIESDTNEFTTQCYELYGAPALGSLVKAGEVNSVYGVVSYSHTSGLDPTRRPVARGEGLASEELVYDQNPQLNRLLTTNFRTTIVGYEVSSQITTYLPPRPPRIHSFVTQCDNSEISTFAKSLDFISSILAANLPQSDDVVAAFIRHACRALPEETELRAESARRLALFLGNDTRRLEGILRRIPND
ncbi:uncharacterized protein METZ01_LOCUS107144, partial [marine metagenome]